MLPFLQFEFDPVSQPAASDDIERSTWCALSIRVGNRFVSNVWDKSLRQERRHLYLPAFPIAEWLVQNWWSFLYEGCRWDRVPVLPSQDREWQWNRRHCLRTADAALMLPALYLFHDGQSLRAEWHDDPPGSMPNMPGEFISQGVSPLDPQATVESLSVFIDETLRRVSHLPDLRVTDLVHHWQAVQAADSSEKNFCIFSSRMGLDPYDDELMTDDLAAFIETFAEGQPRQLISDFTEIAEARTLTDQWKWLQAVRNDFSLQTDPTSVIPNSLANLAQSQFGHASPALFGYELASRTREIAKLSFAEPLESVPDIAFRVLNIGLRLEDRNHIPGSGVRAMVGLPASDREVVGIGPLPTREDNRRFLAARCLYYACSSTHDCQRLVTDAYSWDQKASRAFAAELLAPRQALRESVVSDTVNAETVDQLSDRFNVSAIVIEKQLENSGVPVFVE